MTTSDPTPSYASSGNSPDGQTASDRNESDRRRRARRARSSNESPSDSQDAQAGSDASGAFSRASELLNATVARIQRQPYASMAIAGGVGFVVGGALSFRAGRVVLGAAARHMSHELFKQIS